LAEEKSEKAESFMKKLNLVGSKVGRFRYQRGWTQEMLAAQVQLAGWMISRSKISRIESGLAPVYDSQLFLFAEPLFHPAPPFKPARLVPTEE
jgi:transcriptional regulator with XRE-family HTH domain